MKLEHSVLKQGALIYVGAIISHLVKQRPVELANQSLLLMC